MRDRIRSNSIRNIRKSFPRFLSLLIMSALGVFAFAGLMATAPDMIATLDRYLDDADVYDIRIFSDLGLEEADVESIKGVEGVKDAESAYSRDVISLIGKDEYIVNVSSIPERLNKPELTSGSFPQNKNEIVVEEKLLENHNLSIGDYIELKDDSFYEKKLQITGTVKSPLFYNSVNVDSNRGVTNIGSGIINYYAYVEKEDFAQDYVSYIYVTAEGAKEKTTSYPAYTKIVDEVKENLESIKEKREEARRNSIIEQGKKEIEERTADAKKELDNAKIELDNAKDELNDADIQLTEGKNLLESAQAEIDAVKNELERAAQQLNQKKEELENGRRLLTQAGDELYAKKAELDNAKLELDKGKQLLDENKKTLETAKIKLAEGKKELDGRWNELNEGKRSLDKVKAELDKKQKLADDAATQIAEAKEKLDEGKNEIENLKDTRNTINVKYKQLSESEHIGQDIIESEVRRMQKDIDELKVVADRMLAEYRNGNLTPEMAEKIIIEEISNYSRQPTVLEELIFYYVALEYINPLIDQAQEEYDAAYKKYEAGLKEYEEGKKVLDEAWVKYRSGIDEYNNAKKLLDKAQQEYENRLKQYNDGKTKLDDGYAKYYKNKKLYDDGLSAINSAFKEYFISLSKFHEGEAAIAQAQNQYNDGLSQYNAGLDEFQSKKGEFEAAEEDYLEGLRQYNEGLSQYENGRANLDAEIKKAQKELENLKAPSWYIYDRTDYQTYSDYIDDARSIRNLSRVFPIVFFAVAILVSLISMSRMVEHDRLEIGTLKSMGFSREKILTKYVHFSLLATAIGGIIGASLGLIILPTLIFNIYKILFEVPNLILQFCPETTLPGFFITMIFVSGAGLITAVLVMREKPASLLRQKAPKMGKRIILERISFFWKKLKFSNKVTIRNLFRYKSRGLVTMFGILGCTALILSGFGLKDSIVDIPTAQFRDIFRFEAMVYVRGMDGEKESKEKISEITNTPEIKGHTEVMRMSVKSEGYGANVIVADDNEAFSDIISFSDYKTGENLELKKDCVIITDKFARLTDLAVGDYLEFSDLDGKQYKFKISGIVKNHFEHFIFADRQTFEKIGNYTPNIIYVHLDEMTQEAMDNLSEKLLENEEVLNVTYRSKLVNNADNMLKSLDKVVVILIILSAFLSFVVLYNLSNININERRREIATLKVLGFYEPEVDGYITKENAIITIVGIALGLFVGIFLTDVVVSTVEIEKASFMHVIKWKSFVIAGLMSALFTFIVNRITHLSLKHINMIDSLKSVE